MHRKTWLGLVIGLALSLPAAAQTVDELIAKNLANRGGADKLKAVQTLRMTGTMTVGPGIEAPALMEMKRGQKMRLDITVQGMTVTQAYDGKTGWQVMPFQGNPNAEPMSPEDLKDADEQADMDGPLVDYKAKGHKVELVGKDKVEGTDAYKLRVTLKGGDVRYVYLDAESLLEIKTEAKRTIRGTEIESESTIGDYKEVGGLLFPHSFESGAKGRPEKQKVTIAKTELNVPIDDARFTMPTKGEPAKPKD